MKRKLEISHICWHDIEGSFHFAFPFYLRIKAKGSLRTQMLPLGSFPWRETIYPRLEAMCLTNKEAVALLFWEHKKSIDFLCKWNMCLENTKYSYFYIILRYYHFWRKIFEGNCFFLFSSFISNRGIYSKNFHRVKFLAPSPSMCVILLQVCMKLPSTFWKTAAHCHIFVGLMLEFYCQKGDPHLWPTRYVFSSLFGCLDFIRSSELNESFLKVRVWTRKRSFNFN